MRSSKHKSRREFLTTAAKATAGVAVAGLRGCFPDVGGSWPKLGQLCRVQDAGSSVESPSRVVEIYRSNSLIEESDGGTEKKPVINEDAIRPMVDDLLKSLTEGADDPWRIIFPDFSRKMRIGIKVNCLNTMLPTSVPVVKAVADSLRESLDIDGKQILVWDRRLDELVPAPPRARFDAEKLGVQVIGTYKSASDTSGPGYSEPICGYVAGNTPRLSRIFTELTDVTINLPVLKTHGVSGVTAALKNIYGIIDNPSDYHNNLNLALPALYALPPIRNRIRLTILDALVAVTVGGTDSAPDTYPKRILASLDPLALDKYAVDLTNQLREEKNLGLKEVDPKFLEWLDNGQELGLGSLDFELEKLSDIG